MSNESDQDLQLMHTLVSKALLEGLQSPDEKMRMRAVDQARKFLKDNHIEAGQTLEELEEDLKDLPTFDDTDGLVDKMLDLDDYR